MEKLEKIIRILDEKMAEDITALKIDELTVIADYFVIASGTSAVHIRSLSDELEDKLEREDGIRPLATEGRATGWILLDYGDIVVHLFTPDAREHFNLERLWSDGARIDVSAYVTAR